MENKLNMIEWEYDKHVLIEMYYTIIRDSFTHAFGIKKISGLKLSHIKVFFNDIEITHNINYSQEKEKLESLLKECQNKLDEGFSDWETEMKDRANY